MSLLLDYPWYYVLGCLLTGAAYALLLYWVRDAHSALGRRLRVLLGLLRGVTVFFLALLLLAPMVRRSVNETERPVILLACDRSESVAADAAADSLCLARLDQLSESLGRHYDVQRYDYGGVTTDMSQVVTDLKQQYAHRNVGAMILTGDGLWNTGSNPASSVADCRFPVYTVALGDTARKRDASVSSIRCGRIAYLGNAFPVEVTVAAQLLKGSRRQLTVIHDGKVVFAKMLDYDNDNFSATEQFTIDASKAGVQRYTVRIEPSEGEVTLLNNERSFSVEVVDGHQKIAIVAAAPHPDVAALRHSIEGNPNYEVETFVAKDFKGSLKDYSLLILHQIPSRGGVRLDPGDTPCIYILGSQSDLSQFNALHAGLEVATRLSKTNEATAMAVPGFAPFSVDEAALKAVEAMPPLTSPFGDYRLDGDMQCLFTAKIGNVDSRQPLIAVGSRQGVRRTVIAGEGLWRWRLADYQASSGHDHFDNLVGRLVTYTSLRVDKDRFRLVAKSIYRQDQDVLVEAELYDENYEMTNAPEAALSVNGRDYAFNRSGSRYSLNLGQLPPDAYGCTATVRYNGKDYKASCSFVVEEVNLESLNLTADYALMQAIAASTGGEMLLPADLDRLPQLLEARGDIRPVIYSHTRYVELISLWWVLALVIAMLAIEWVTRKYNGEL